MGKEVLSVSAIKQGTVIDHIQAGKALSIVRLLNLAEGKQQVTLGMNLGSRSMGHKDIIKLESKELTEQEANQVAIFSPSATIHIIQDYVVVKRFQVALPDVMEKALLCPNTRCITNSEEVLTRFQIVDLKKSIQLTCKYCEKSFTQNEMKAAHSL